MINDYNRWWKPDDDGELSVWEATKLAAHAPMEGIFQGVIDLPLVPMELIGHAVWGVGKIKDLIDHTDEADNLKQGYEDAINSVGGWNVLSNLRDAHEQSDMRADESQDYLEEYTNSPFVRGISELTELGGEILPSLAVGAAVKQLKTLAQAKKLANLDAVATAAEQYAGTTASNLANASETFKTLTGTAKQEALPALRRAVAVNENAAKTAAKLTSKADSYYTKLLANSSKGGILNAAKKVAKIGIGTGTAGAVASANGLGGTVYTSSGGGGGLGGIMTSLVGGDMGTPFKFTVYTG